MSIHTTETRYFVFLRLFGVEGPYDTFDEAETAAAELISPGQSAYVFSAPTAVITRPEA